MDEIESIIAHVRVLLNTRKGDAVCVPELGITDFTDVVHSFPNGPQDLANSMQKTLLAFEPRLSEVSVRHVPVEGELVLRFEISAQCAGRSGRSLRMTTMVRPGGRVDVAG